MTNFKPNLHPATGIAYGFVAANELDPEIVDALMAVSDDDFDGEPYAEGVYDDVRYRTSYLGGALSFFILESPVVTDRAGLASPCVPNAGILSYTMDGGVQAYSVPEFWWMQPEYGSDVWQAYDDFMASLNEGADPALDDDARQEAGRQFVEVLLKGMNLAGVERRILRELAGHYQVEAP